MKQFIGGRQRKIYTGPKGGTYYMKGGKKHYITTKMEGGNSQPPSSQDPYVGKFYKEIVKDRNKEYTNFYYIDRIYDELNENDEIEYNCYQMNEKKVLKKKKVCPFYRFNI